MLVCSVFRLETVHTLFLRFAHDQLADNCLAANGCLLVELFSVQQSANVTHSGESIIRRDSIRRHDTKGRHAFHSV